MRGHAAVGAVSDVDAGGVRPGEVAGHVPADADCLLLHGVRHEVGLHRHGADCLAGEQGGHEIGAGFLEQLDGARAGVGAVFDAGDAGFERRDDAVFFVRVGCDLAAHPGCRQHDFLEFVHFHLLAGTGGAIGQHAAGGRDLDEVGAVLDGVARRPAAIVGAVADALVGPELHEFRLDAADVRMAAGDADAACRDDAGPVDPAVVDRVAQRIHLLAGRPDVAHRRKAGEQRLHREMSAAHLHELRRHLEFFFLVVRPEFPLQVHVHVHEARQYEAVTEVHDLCILAVRRSVGKAVHDIDDPLTLDHDGLPRLWAFAGYGQQFAGMDQQGFGVCQ